MKRAAIIYNIIVLSVFLTAGLINSQNSREFLTALLFAPPLIYFCRLLIGNLNYSPFPVEPTESSAPLEPSRTLTNLDEPHESPISLEPLEISSDPNVADVNRRLFLKLIGGAGMSVFMMSIFTDRAHAAFFGSMPVPGAMTIKDSTGQAIDPAEKQPTDGYEISELDDSATPAYYGFVHKTGAWYISREDENGSYRYTKGLSDFPTAWEARATHTYDYFDNVF